jgi:hypothetical protein
MASGQMTKRERVEAAMARKETDRPPVFDILLNDDCIRHFTGMDAPVGEDGIRTKAKAIAAMFDMTRGAEMAPAVPGSYIDEDGFENMFDRWCVLGHRSRPFHDEKGAAEWLKKAAARLAEAGRTMDLGQHAKMLRERFLQIQGYIGDDTVVLLHQSGTGLDDIRYKLGFEFFSYLASDEPGLISEYMERHTELEVRIIHAYADSGLSPCALTYGDIAMKNSLMHSPEWLRQEFFPRLKRLNDAYHEHGVKCLFHSDGNLMEIMDDLLQTGIDGLNPIETAAGMNLGEVYRKYGDRIFLTGGIDMSQLLSYGTPEEVLRVSEEALRSAPRGYFIGSTTEIDNSAKLENVLAMLRAARVIP